RGGVCGVRCKWDALRETICSSRSSIEYERGICLERAIGSRCAHLYRLTRPFTGCCPLSAVHPIEGYPPWVIPPMHCGLTPFVFCGRSLWNDQQAAAARCSGGEWFHTHRAARCHHHPRHPAGNRDPVVPVVQGSREPVGCQGECPCSHPGS